MRKEIKHKLPYRIEGEDKEIEIKINFISQRVMNEYSDVIQKASEAEKANDRMSDINTLIQSEIVEKKDGYEERIEQLEKELKDCIDTILDFNNNGYFNQRTKLLKRILIDNGYKDDELLMSQDFWDENVDPTDLIYFMTMAVYKDIDNKKKVHRI